MANLGLKKTITNKHGGQGPGTTIANKKCQAIDGIWESQGIIFFREDTYPSTKDLSQTIGYSG